MDLNKAYDEKDNQYYSHTRIELLQFIPEGINTALDVGCGKGNFGALLKDRFGCTVGGIEPDTKSAQEAKEKLDFVVNDIFDLGISNSINMKFDCIFFNDVLEHLVAPDEALALAGRFLNSNGYIVASIPSILSYPVILGLLRYKDFEYANAGVLDKTHLRFFTPKSMVRLFQTSGYKVELIQGINKQNFFYLKLLNLITLKYFDVMNYPQFVIVARLKELQQ